MPRKPHSVFLIIETPHADPAVLDTSLQTWRLPLDDQTPEEAVEQWHTTHATNLGTTIYMVEDTKVQAYGVGLKLDPIDDPRLDEETEPDSQKERATQ